MKEKIKTYGVEKAAKYLLLLGTLSFLGWAYEVGYVFFVFGVFKNVGFMRLPFCPIYGFALLSIYFLGGTPTESRGILNDISNKPLRYLAYGMLAFLVPTVFELFVGLFLDKGLGLRLWSYQDRPFNINGYVALEVSLFWAALITLAMRFVFPLVKKWVFALPSAVVYVASSLLLITASVDVLTKFI